MPRKITYRKALNEGLDEELANDDNVVIIGEEVAEYNGAYKVTEGLYMSGGLINVPIVVRGPANGGTNVGATHSHTPENIFANMPGLKVVSPATAYDVKGLIKSAIRDNDPVYFMESTVLYGQEWEVPSNDEIEGGELLIPLGLADVKREVVDLRSIRPLDEQTILESVKKTHRAIYIEENKPFCGVGAQIASMIQEKAFDYLDAPVLRITSMDSPAIYSPPLEKMQIPDASLIIQKALSIC
ncbi:UNVERIFIED_CONTAM: hypothetical protein GTU68_059783 [Idotea baltica]|nr:hypothetical protein [Idotea baltica]